YEIFVIKARVDGPFAGALPGVAAGRAVVHGPGWCKTECYVGDRLLGVDDERVLQLFTDLMSRALT
ncbi:MAG: hypothetical protein ACRESB_23520, partial [Pseudomonas sp.]